MLYNRAVHYNSSMAKKSLRKTKNSAWFIKVRGSYLPNSWQGWLTYIPFVGFLVWSAIVLYSKIGDAAIATIFYFVVMVCSAVVMTWIAARTS
jgi:hypothetical protein